MQGAFSRDFSASLTAVIVTSAALAKLFIPLYLIGSTAAFASLTAVGLLLIVMSRRAIAPLMHDTLILIVVSFLFYLTCVMNFILESRSTVPVTYLLGILIFHFVFMSFGFAAARAIRAVLVVICLAGVIYTIILAQHALRFNGIMRGSNIDDIFGVGVPGIFITFHQNVGFFLGAASLAAFGLTNSRFKSLATFPSIFALLVMFHIAARTALVALVISLAFLGFTNVWMKSKTKAVILLATLIVTVILASNILYQQHVPHKVNGAVSADAVSRTIQELHDPKPGLRMQIWAQTLTQIASEPSKLLFGRGVGNYPVDNGIGPPDWLLNPTEGSKHYPHNIYLEISYETGLFGLLLFVTMTLLPLGTALSRWTTLSSEQRGISAIYLFILVSATISGAFAYGYNLQFFLALNFGAIVLGPSSYEIAAVTSEKNGECSAGC